MFERDDTDGFLDDGMADTDEELLTAIIEGDGDPSLTHPEKTSKMLKGMRKEYSFSIPSYIGGPIYWAYRRCYFATAVCLAAYILVVNIVLYSGNKLLELVPPFVTGALFYWVYRKHARALVNKMRALGIPEERSLDFLREKGGVDLRAALGTTLAFLALVAASVAVCFMLPWH